MRVVTKRLRFTGSATAPHVCLTCHKTGVSLRIVFLLMVRSIKGYNKERMFYILHGVSCLSSLEKVMEL